MIDQITLDLIESLKTANADIIHEIQLGLASTKFMSRGRVLPLTQQERVQRMLYLVGDVPLHTLDNSIDKRPQVVLAFDGYGSNVTPSAIHCASGYYLLKEHNGGKNPRAVDPFDRWTNEGSRFINRTGDCISAAAWTGGWDRFQPVNFKHIYEGWINTDSMILDCHGAQKCFVPLAEPEDGCYIVCASGAPGHKVGHIGCIPHAPKSGFDKKDKKAWEALKVVNIASMGAGNRANVWTTGRGWFGTGALFVRPQLQMTTW